MMKGALPSLSILLLIMSLPNAAMAQGDGGRGGGQEQRDDSPSTGGGTDGTGIFSEVEYSNSIGSTEPPGADAPVVDWEPPPCWYEPRTASQAREYVNRMLNTYAHMPPEDVGDARSDLADHYINGEPYEGYNLDKEDEGYFYFGVVNPAKRDHPDAYSCSGLAEWVENGQRPARDPAISPEVLAEAAYEWLPLPETEISLNPAADVPQTVNLPVWIWQDTADIEEVSATARIDSLDMEATTVATPSALTIEPGSEDVVLYPGDGECEINSDGTIGDPYTDAKADEDPPCGATYLRSTGEGETYELTATITWSVTWTGTGNPTPQELPSAVLETSHELTVDEIQTIVR